MVPAALLACLNFLFHMHLPVATVSSTTNTSLLAAIVNRIPPMHASHNITSHWGNLIYSCITIRPCTPPGALYLPLPVVPLPSAAAPRWPRLLVLLPAAHTLPVVLTNSKGRCPPPGSQLWVLSSCHTTRQAIINSSSGSRQVSKWSTPVSTLDRLKLAD
jgi:hypothetical protein